MTTESFSPQTADDRNRYAVNNRREIERIIQGMMQERVLISVTLTTSQESFLSVFVGLDEASGCAYVEDKQNIRGEPQFGSGAEFEARHQGVRIQFRAPEAVRVQYDGMAAYRIDLPARIYRFQRRQFYRMVLSALQPATCMLPMGSREVEAHVIDISVGGVGLRYDPGEAPLEPGRCIEGARLRIPNFGEYPVAVKVCTNQVLTLKNDVKIQRAGCEFINLPATVERVIQNYIFKLEQERRMMGGT